jgi:hypothetical protein
MENGKWKNGRKLRFADTQLRITYSLVLYSQLSTFTHEVPWPASVFPHHHDLELCNKLISAVSTNAELSDAFY